LDRTHWQVLLVCNSKTRIRKVKAIEQRNLALDDYVILIHTHTLILLYKGWTSKGKNRQQHTCPKQLTLNHGSMYTVSVGWQKSTATRNTRRHTPALEPGLTSRPWHVGLRRGYYLTMVLNHRNKGDRLYQIDVWALAEHTLVVAQDRERSDGRVGRHACSHKGNPTKPGRP
jgi:hypothetical protein